MRQYKEQLTGTGMVYRFTLQQFLKNKANIIVLIIIVLISMASVPISSLLGGNAKKADTSDIQNVYFSDMDEPYSFTHADLQRAADESEYWKNTVFSGAPEGGSAGAPPASGDVYADMSFNPEAGAFEISIKANENTGISEGDLSLLGSFITEQFDQARYRTLNISEGQLAFVMSGWESDTALLEDYLEDEGRWNTQYWLQMIYSIVLMMVSVLSVSYIVRTVIEEKASKLIELLMVSVKPLALIVGKILASMTYVLLTMLAMVGGYFISRTVCSRFMNVSSLTELLSSTPIGFSSGFLQVSPLSVIAFVVSLLLAYLTFSIIAGLSATGCSSMEDSEGATMGVTFLIMAGYFVAIFTSMNTSPVLATVTSMIPVVSVFCAPVHFLMGNINIGMLILSWLLQAAVVVILAVFCARIYSSLLMHRGSRVKLKEMLSMAKTVKTEKEAH